MAGNENATGFQESGENHVPSAALITQLYEELKSLARARLAAERIGHTLSATALVHEAYLRLDGEGRTWPSRKLFFFAAAEAMQRVLVDHARRRNAAKRGDGMVRATSISDGMPEIEAEGVIDAAALKEHLDALRRTDQNAHQVLMLRYYAGLSADDTADLLGVDRRTVTRRWQAGRAWLLDRMVQDPNST